MEEHAEGERERERHMATRVLQYYKEYALTQAHPHARIQTLHTHSHTSFTKK